MIDPGPWGLIGLPVALGLLGFIEPCSLGSTVLFVKYLEGKNAPAKIAETMLFAVTRGAFIGTLGVVAVLLGRAFVPLQSGAWIVLGAMYVALGALLVFGQARRVMVTIGPRLSRISGRRGAAGFGLLFGLNIPACAAPLLAALLAAVAAGGATGSAAASGFISLGMFGLALSAPLVAAVFFEPARRAIETAARWSSRFPIWTGVLLIALGAWSIRFGLIAAAAPL